MHIWSENCGVLEVWQSEMAAISRSERDGESAAHGGDTANFPGCGGRFEVRLRNRGWVLQRWKKKQEEEEEEEEEEE